ncbi:hypothetical protein [uncultured Chryseobacterium sp.]|uniref:hypothetical protein n=1 Tax=uncultured Chryseobacterium sp. TaxID=259322 RepID=UPI00260DB834|nr:hypothetical protein [uncultured Chryseobacterium sp.]
MIKKFGLWVSAAALVMMQSCSINTETTYFKDSATSMESNVLMDKSAMGMMNMMSESAKSSATPDLGKLSTDWKSLYDIQKDGLITLNQDSVKVLKKMFMKLNKKDGEVLGLSLKYDKLQPKEIVSILTQSKQLKNIPLQNFGQWNGKSLTIDTEKFNMGEFLSEMEKGSKEKSKTAPKTKSDSIEAYGRDMMSGMVGMMRMFNMNFSNTLKFQRPIKTIVGKHDFVKQIDDKTIQINVRTHDLLDGGKELKNKDKKIVITTE